MIRSKELVDHPDYYSSNGLEAIDIIDAYELDFCLGNAIKYILRSGRKDDTKVKEDLEKAIWYINHHITKLGGDNV